MHLKNTIISSIIMLVGIVFLHYLNYSENIPLHKPFSTFPQNIGVWKGTKDHFEQRIYDILKVDDSILYNYKKSNGNNIQLYVGYYQSQQEGELIHSPKHCMPGAGWSIVKTSLLKINSYEKNPKTFKVIKLLLKHGQQKQIMLYWFQSRGRIISSEYMQKIYLVIDSITRHRTDGAFVRLTSHVINNNEDEVLQDLSNFAAKILPILNNYIPS